MMPSFLPQPDSALFVPSPSRTRLLPSPPSRRPLLSKLADGGRRRPLLSNPATGGTPSPPSVPSSHTRRPVAPPPLPVTSPLPRARSGEEAGCRAQIQSVGGRPCMDLPRLDPVRVRPRLRRCTEQRLLPRRLQSSTTSKRGPSDGGLSFELLLHAASSSFERWR